MYPRRDQDGGFTLIELLVVIIIIGVLAAIAVPSYLAQREKGWKSAAVADMKNAATAVETFASDREGSYAGIDGATQDSVELQGEGFNPTQFVSLVVAATVADYCITGVTANLPTKTFQYRSTTGVVDISNGAAPPC